MPDPRTLMVPVLLLTQAILVHWAAGRERPPTPPPLSSLSSSFGIWRQLREDPIAADIAGELRADRLLNRTYLNVSTGSNASLLVAWFGSQRAGASQPHSPKVCLPAAGWIPEVTGQVTLVTAIGTIAVNRYIVVNRGQRDVVLYWYQSPRRVTAGEWQAKFWLMVDALRDNRTDTALVRVVVPSAGQDKDAIATGAAIDFANGVYPLLRDNLPSLKNPG